MIPFYLAMVVLPVAIVVASVVLARTARLRPDSPEAWPRGRGGGS
jgi:hypothetical protein